MGYKAWVMLHKRSSFVSLNMFKEMPVSVTASDYHMHKKKYDSVIITEVTNQNWVNLTGKA